MLNEKGIKINSGLTFFLITITIAIVVSFLSVSNFMIQAMLVFFSVAILITIFMKPWLGIALSVLSLPFERTGTIITPVFGLRVYQILIFITLLALIVNKAVYNKKIPIIKNNVLLALSIFILVNLGSAYFSKNMDDFRMIIFYLFFFVSTLLFIILVETRKKILFIYNALIFTAIFASFYGIFQYIGDVFFFLNTDLVKTGMGFWGGGRYAVRANSLFYEPDIFGGFLVMCLPLIFVKIMFREPKTKKVVYIALFLVMLVALFLTYSRTSWISLICGFMISSIFLKVSFRKKFFILMLLTIIIIISLFLVNYVASDYFSFDLIWRRIADLSEYASNSSTAGRMIFLKGGLSAFYQHPLLGIGPAEATDWSGYIYNIEQISVFKNNRFVAHNIYLDIMIGSGLLGLMAFIWYICSILSCAIKSNKLIKVVDAESNDDLWISYGLLTSIFCELIFGLGHSGLTYPNIWFMGALLVCWYYICKNKYARAS